jgi:hypothetical protein
MQLQDKEIRTKGVQLIDGWRKDWNAFARDALGVRLDREQQEILSSVQFNSRTSVASGTARGKDYVAACSAVCFMYLTPRWNSCRELIENTKVALTAPTERQVKNIMMPEVSRLYNSAKKRGVYLPGRLNSYDIRTDSDEWFLTGFKADEHNHEAWSGFHAVNTMFVVTEASGIAESIFDAIEGNMQGNSRMLLVFNPNTTIGYAARSQKAERWAKYRLNSLTAPNVVEHKIILPGQVDYEWIKDKLENWCTKITEEEQSSELDDFCFEDQWYRPEDLFRVKVLGCFPKVSEDVLIPQQWIELANKRWLERTNAGVIPSSGNEALGVDVAGMGRDSSVLCRRNGNYVFKIEKHNSGGKADHMKVTGKVKDSLDRFKTSKAFIDTIGEGAGVYSRLVEQGYESRAFSCKYSEAARDTRGRDLSDITGQYKFANMRAYLFWAVRDWLDPKNNTGAMLPPDAELLQESTEIKWFFRSDGSIIIEPKEDIKKRLGRSTDKFDAVANTFYPNVPFIQQDLSDLEDDLY